MRRREVLQWLGAAAMSGCIGRQPPDASRTRAKSRIKPIRPIPNLLSRKEYYSFRPWRGGKTLAPVTQVTPRDRSYVHTYFDVTPFSPSHRYLAVTRLPFGNRHPLLGDRAQVCVIDLQEHSIQTIYTTKCWGYQTGANLHWGATDRHLYANDVIDGRAVCIGIDLQTGATLAYAGPLYTIMPDESCVVGFPHELRDVTQKGYGVPPRVANSFATLPPGASADEGIWRTDLKTNEKRLIASLADVAARVPTAPPAAGGTYYFWHTKFNRQGTRLLQVLRYIHPDEPDVRNPMVFTFNPDGSDICFAPRTDRVPVWHGPGGHPNWHSDGVHVIRHMETDGGDKSRFTQVRYDGTDFKILAEKIEGGGHPSVEPTGKYLITDRRDYEGGAAVMKLRLIDLIAEEERCICAIPTIDKKALKDTVFRLDGHPAWSRDYKKVSLQAAPEGERQLFIVDLEGMV
jgi:hypothetical protein